MIWHHWNLKFEGLSVRGQIEWKNGHVLMWNGRFDCSKDLYWRYDDKKKRMDPGYPHDMARWRGVPSNLDAAMHWTDGQTLETQFFNFSFCKICFCIFRDHHFELILNEFN